MKVETVKKTGDEKKLWLKITGADTEFVNALRRTVLSELPCLAVDEIDVYENNSVFRIGLVPLTYEDGIGDDVKITMSLNAEGPCIVYSADLKSTDEKIRPFKETIPLAKLGANQRIRLEAIAVKGKARQHAKFQCALASYNQVPKLPAKAKLCRMHAGETGAGAGETVAREKCEACRLEEKGELEYRDDAFIFFVESYNNLSAEEHLKKAFQIMK